MVSNIELGIFHIADWTAFDHGLFLLALCSVYSLAHWKQLLFLVTAFTIGHSVTLIIAGLDLFRLKSNLVEWLIPVTIALTAIYHLSVQKPHKNTLTYAVCSLFGMIHGLGFSSFFRMIRSEKNIVLDLLGFNIGVEIGQILIILLFLLVSYLFIRLFKVKRRDWNLVINGLCLGAALILIQQNWPF